MYVLSRLTAIFTLQAFVLAMLISTARANDVELADIRPSPLPSGSKITANYVTRTLLPQLIGSDDQLRQRLGFSSLAQINSLDLPDPPFAVFRVGLSRLRGFNPPLPVPSSISLLLERENWFPFSPPRKIVWPVRHLFPIRESSRPASGCTSPSLLDSTFPGWCVASSVQVKWLSGKWEFQQIGRPGLIKKLTKFGNGNTHFVIWIPVLNLHYLAQFDPGGDLKITAITDDRYVKHPVTIDPFVLTNDPFKAGQELSGYVVFRQLKDVVQAIDPDGPPG